MFESALLKSFFPILLFTGILGVILILLRKYSKKAKKIKASQIDLSIISRIPLQQKSHLYVVKAGAKTLLLGATDHNINTLADLTVYKSIDKTGMGKIAVGNYNDNDLDNLTLDKKLTHSKKDNSLSFRSFLRSTLSKS